MKQTLFFLIAFIIPGLGSSLDYTLATDYPFVHRKERVYIDERGFKEDDLYSLEEGEVSFANTYPALGIVGQSKGKKPYLFPILELDWCFHRQWKVNAIFPLDFSLHYFFANKWSTALSYRSFGSWYRSFRRIGKRVNDPDLLASDHTNGLDLGIYLNTTNFSAGLFGGTNFGGRILLRNQNGAKPVYFHFDAAAYGGVKASVEF